jgi:hypothetical protein
MGFFFQFYEGSLKEYAVIHLFATTILPSIISLKFGSQFGMLLN